jgi:hypothetical protein
MWLLLAAARAAFEAGSVLRYLYVQFQVPVPYPSIADAAWLASYALALAGLVVAARGTRLRLDAVLDGLVVGLALAAVLAAALLAPLLQCSGTTWVEVVLKGAYPVLDIILLVAVLVLVASRAWALGPQ